MIWLSGFTSSLKAILLKEKQ